MHFNVLNRKVHYWAAFATALPVLVIIVSGLFLQAKKQWDWVQPAEQRGSGTVPQVSFEALLAAARSHPELAVTGWHDVDRIDVRPSKGIAKVTLTSGWEVQVDLATGRALQIAYRRSDVIESIHDGSIFAGDWTKLGVFLPAGLGLLLLWVGGMWMWWVPFIAKRRRKTHRLHQRRAAVVLLGAVLGGWSASALPQDPGSRRGQVVDDRIGLDPSGGLRLF